VKLVWSEAGMRDLLELAAYIAAESEQTAKLVETRIHREATLLLAFPHAGRAGRVSGTRERVVRKTPFILVYRASQAELRILRLLRGARKWPAHFGAV
jgi:toxin ParE1/3/4